MSHTYKLGEKTLTFTYTRKIAREVNDELMRDVVVRTVDGVQNMEIKATNTDRSEELKVRLVSGLTVDEIDTMDNAEYEKLALEVNKFIEKKKA